MAARRVQSGDLTLFVYADPASCLRRHKRRARGYQPGRFSFNVKGGRQKPVRAMVWIKVEMHFPPDVYVPCDVCKGKRYNRETLEVKYKHKSIHEVLDMTVEDARAFFDAVPALARKLR